MRYISRNDTLGFAHRTRKNLDYIQHAYKRGEDVHVVTQLTVSLLGLIVYPKERKLAERVRKLKLSDLETQGWPMWRIDLGHADTFYQLIRTLRNAVAHGHVHFSSDDRDIENVTIQFENYHQSTKKLTWRASIASTQLDDFCRRFIELIESEIG